MSKKTKKSASQVILIEDTLIEEEEMQEVFEAAKTADFSKDAESNDALQMYLKEIGDIPLISDPAEEKKLAERAADGDVDAVNRLWEGNLRLVVSIAKKYCVASGSLDMLDLIQEGNLGLQKAINKFKPQLGYRFSTYAYWWIKQSITRAIADHGKTIRVPVHKQEAINKQMKVVRSLQQELGRNPSSEEIADVMGTDVDTVEELIELAQDTKSLDCCIGEEEDTTIGDFIPDDSTDPGKMIDNSMLSADIGRVLKTLPEREANILILRFGLNGSSPCTLEEVGKLFGITRERTRQLEKDALQRIRRSKEGQCLRDYLAA